MYCIFNRYYGIVCVFNEHFYQYLKTNFCRLDTFFQQGLQLYNNIISDKNIIINDIIGPIKL